MSQHCNGSEPADDDPDERTLYTYDESWNLLEERVESPYLNASSPKWTWEIGSGFNNDYFAQVEPGAQISIKQYVWDPTSKDELVLFRDGEGADYFALTDHRRDVVALVPANGDFGAIQRVRYSSYGAPEPQLIGDIDADGDVDADDLSIVASLNMLTAIDTGWHAGADTLRDGIVGVNLIRRFIIFFDIEGERTAFLGSD